MRKEGKKGRMKRGRERERVNEKVGKKERNIFIQGKNERNVCLQRKKDKEIEKEK